MPISNPPSTFAHLRSILALPFMVIVVAPSVIYYRSGAKVLFDWLEDYSLIFTFLGGLFLIAGLLLFFRTLSLFHFKGDGTLAPWDPPKQLVVVGPYRYVRNPMISGVNAILLAEAFLIPSGYILLWQIFFLGLNHCYFILKEEPDLINRFGKDYEEYMREVPRWIPRRTAWNKKHRR